MVARSAQSFRIAKSAETETSSDKR